MVIKPGECVNCDLCEMLCPDFAIYSVRVESGEKEVSSEA